LPSDVALQTITGRGLDAPLMIPLDPNNKALEAEVVDEILARLKNAMRAIIIVDGGELP
jgi:TPP-dependent 2-oxoacid decarboxylase